MRCLGPALGLHCVICLSEDFPPPSLTEPKDNDRSMAEIVPPPLGKARVLQLSTDSKAAVGLRCRTTIDEGAE